MLFLNYYFVSGDDGDEFGENDHYNFKYIPRHTVSLGLYRNMHGVSLSLVGNYQSEQEGPGMTIESQVSFDINLGYSHRLNSSLITHTFSAKNIGDKEIFFPEYVRRTLDKIPDGYGRRLFYTLTITH